MGQLGAILRSFGIRFGYYDPKDWRLATLIDPVVTSWADAVTGGSKVLFASEEAKAEAIKEYCEGVCSNLHKLCEANLCALEEQGQGMKFIAGSALTIADFVLVSYVANNMTNPASPVASASQAILDETPKFKAYTERILFKFKEHLTTRPTPPPL